MVKSSIVCAVPALLPYSICPAGDSIVMCEWYQCQQPEGSSHEHFNNPAPSSQDELEREPQAQSSLGEWLCAAYSYVQELLNNVSYCRSAIIGYGKLNFMNMHRNENGGTCSLNFVDH